jgi:hypothetical protein
MAVRFEDARDAIGVLPGCGDLRCTLGIEQVVRGSSAMWCSLPRRASISPRWGDSQCGPGEERLHAGGWKVMTELPNQVKRPLNRDSVMPGTAPAAPHRTAPSTLSRPRAPVPAQSAAFHVPVHSNVQARQRSSEAEHPVMLGPVPLLAPKVVMPVLAAARRVGPHRLDVASRVRADPDVLPRGRDHQRLDPARTSGSVTGAAGPR